MSEPYSGVFPIAPTPFTESGEIDLEGQRRVLDCMIDQGVDGICILANYSEQFLLSDAERDQLLDLCISHVAGRVPVVVTVSHFSTQLVEQRGARAAKAGADGLMVVPSPIYHTNAEETVATLKAVAAAGDLPVMIYSNRLAYRVDVTVPIMEELAADERFVAVKESSDDIRRSTDIINAFGDRFDLFTGVDNLAFEALSVGAIGWVAGLVTAFPSETVAIYRLMRAGRRDEALAIYRWFRPLLDLDVSTYLVQNIKLAEVLAIGTNDRVRMPRQPLSGERRAMVEKVVRDALATRPELPKLDLAKAA